VNLDRSPGAEPMTTSEQTLRKLAEDYGLAYLTSVDDSMIDASLVADVPVEWVRANLLLPVRKDDALCVLTADPTRVEAQDYLALLVGKSLRPVVAEADIIRECIERCYYSREDSPDAFLKDMSLDDDSGVIVRASDDLLQGTENAPVTQLVNLILLEAMKRRASDVHFEPFEASLRVRYRIDGVLYEQTQPPKHLQEALVSRLKVMARMDIAEKRLPQDGMARVRVGEREVDVRVSTIPVAEGERVVLRLLDRDSALLPLTALGMAEDIMTRFSNLLAQPNGIVVVSGPTGSGKTTTLYAALSQLDASRRNILTIEDPIEYQLPNIGQIQVKPKIGLTFANGLRHILRQDPDVILVGETRDLETAEISIRASLTGHLVFTTLHTNDATGSVLRMVDIGVEPYLLASCLRGVLAQRLVRNLCTACKREATATAKEAAQLEGITEGATIWHATGCNACMEGYSGRSGLFELLLVDEAMQDVMRGGRAGLDTIKKLAEAGGMQGLVADGAARCLAGATSVAEVVNVVG
jgi:general secretion pathway protein E